MLMLNFIPVAAVQVQCEDSVTTCTNEVSHIVLMLKQARENLSANENDRATSTSLQTALTSLSLLGLSSPLQYGPLLHPFKCSYAKHKPVCLTHFPSHTGYLRLPGRLLMTKQRRSGYHSAVTIPGLGADTVSGTAETARADKRHVTGMV